MAKPIRLCWESTTPHRQFLTFRSAISEDMQVKNMGDWSFWLEVGSVLSDALKSGLIQTKGMMGKVVRALLTSALPITLPPNT